MRRGILGLVFLLALMAGLTGTAQAAKYDDDTVIVKFASGVSSAQRAALFDTAGVTGKVGNVAGVGAQVVSVKGDPAVWPNGSTAACWSPMRANSLRGPATRRPGFPELSGSKTRGRRRHGRRDIDAPRGWTRRLGSFPQRVAKSHSRNGIDRPTPTSAARPRCGGGLGGTVSERILRQHARHPRSGTIAAKGTRERRGRRGFNSNRICKGSTRRRQGLTSETPTASTDHARGASDLMSLGGGASAT